MMTRLRSTLALLAIMATGCTGPDGARPNRLFISAEVPWSVAIPSGWQVSTNRSEPDPRLRVGALSSTISNVPFPFDRSSPGPNSGPGASVKLGPSAVVVEVLLLWYPPDDPIEWNPADSVATSAGSPTGWHDDSQNPGWAFRERKVCLADTCVSVVEWHGPYASRQNIGSIQRIARSIELDAGWIDPIA